ncbi:VWA domain-containing protein [Candidatus Binatia bacterium]|nr:VWA domain-containing protein [Candidatus Binatia bacterium]
MTQLFGWTLTDPAWLLLLLALPLVSRLRTRRARPVFVIPFASRWAGIDDARRSPLATVAATLAIAAMIVALARPQRIDPKEQRTQDGYDIVMAIDISGSMLAEDGERAGRRISRIEAVKPVIDAFVARRPNDRIAVVAFGGRAYTLAPLTTDHDWLAQQVNRLHVGLVEDGTAVGDALALAVARLDQPARADGGRRQGGFVVLLTDGATNAGVTSPADAAALAAREGVPVYTIGTGQSGFVPMPVFSEDGRKVGYQTVQSDLDEETLVNIATATGGHYYRAEDADTIDTAFAAIDRANPIAIDAAAHRRGVDMFPYFVWPALLLLAAAFASAAPARTEVPA